MLLGVDIGGTFTDFVLIEDDGRVRLHKRLTSPADPARAFMEGVRELRLPTDALVIHGSTIATNALLERRGARTALITTQGFADVIEIGRQNRPELYALVPHKPAPLVPREWRFELRERVTAQGQVLIPLDPQDVENLIPQLKADGIESVAVCFLFSFLHPEHEQLVEQILRQNLFLYLSLSSFILPEYREYERLATTVLNAYIMPLMDRYLDRLETELSPRPLRIMQSNGGCITSTLARAQAARTALSGPAGGVVGAMAIAQQSPITNYQLPLERERLLGSGNGGPNIITFDMGGTSTDVCLCPGHIPFTSEGEIRALHMPLRLPMIDIHTVGAGGGSLAQVDAGGALTVGPASAGAEPGPVCYGRGGRIPTVTDANLVLNRLHPAHFLGGRMALDVEATHTALRQLQAAIQMPSIEATAWGIVQVANAAMERAIRKISVERGYDSREFTLVAFGGAGPLHACELAERLAIPRVLVPRLPGVLSALGMVLSDLVKDYAQTIMRRAEALTQAELDALFAPLEERARAEMKHDGVSDPVLQRSIDIRYVGQSFEINVPLNSQLPRLVAANDFHSLHAQRYGHAHPAAPVECVTLRLRAIGPMPRPVFEPLPPGEADPSPAQVGENQVWFATGDAGGLAGHLAPYPTPLYERDLLRAGNRLVGPAILFQLDATTAIPPDWVGTVDKWGQLLLERPLAGGMLK